MMMQIGLLLLLMIVICDGMIDKQKLLKQIKQIGDKKLGRTLYEIVEHCDHDNYDISKDLNTTDNKTRIVEQMLTDQFLREMIRKNKHKLVESGLEVSLEGSKYKKIVRNNSEIVINMVVYKDSRQSEYYKELSMKMELELMINETLDRIEREQKNESSYLNQNMNG